MELARYSVPRTLRNSLGLTICMHGEGGKIMRDPFLDLGRHAGSQVEGRDAEDRVARWA